MEDWQKKRVGDEAFLTMVLKGLFPKQAALTSPETLLQLEIIVPHKIYRISGGGGVQPSHFWFNKSFR